MDGNGVRTQDFPLVDALDEVIGNKDGTSGRQALGALVQQVSAMIVPAELPALQAFLAQLQTEIDAASAEVFQAGEQVEIAKDTAISASRFDQIVADAAERDALTVASGYRVFMRSDRHLWQYNGATWDDEGPDPTEVKVDKADGFNTTHSYTKLQPAEFDAAGFGLRFWDAEGNMVLTGDIIANGRRLTGAPSASNVAWVESQLIGWQDNTGLALIGTNRRGEIDGVPSRRLARQIAAFAGSSIHTDAIVSNDTLFVLGDSIVAEGSGWVSELAAALGGTRPVVNRGIGGQDTKNIVQRQGGYPIPVAAVTIPASGSVTLVLTDGDPYYVPSGTRTFACSLGGVAASASSTATVNEWTFTRTESGDAVAIDAGTPVILAEQEGYRASTLVLQPGPNVSPESPPATRLEWQPYIDIVAGAVAHLTPKVKRFILIGEYHRIGGLENPEDAAPVVASLNIFNEMLREIVGDGHYHDQANYAANQAIYEAIELGLLPDDGSFPTATDLLDMEHGLCPRSLLVDLIHPTAVLKQLFALNFARELKMKGQ